MNDLFVYLQLRYVSPYVHFTFNLSSGIINHFKCTYLLKDVHLYTLHLLIILLFYLVSTNLHFDLPTCVIHYFYYTFTVNNLLLHALHWINLLFIYRISVEPVVCTHTYITSCLPTSLLFIILLYPLETTLIFSLPNVKVSNLSLPLRCRPLHSCS